MASASSSRLITFAAMVPIRCVKFLRRSFMAADARCGGAVVACVRADASFSENFYSLKRVRVGSAAAGRLTDRDRRLSLLLLVGIGRCWMVLHTCLLMAHPGVCGRWLCRM